MMMRGLALVSLVVIGACGHGDDPDAYGNFETTDVVVSAETSGRLLRFTPEEGDRADAGALVAIVDTMQLMLERDQLVAQRGVATSRAAEVARQITVLDTEREIAQRTYERTQRLHAQQAATAQQLDLTERDYRSLSDRAAAARAQRRTALQDITSSEARVAQIADRLRRSLVMNPVAGVVLATYVEAGEFVQPGQPLYKIANLDSMTLRAYVTEPQLSQVRIGQHARVSLDVRHRERQVLPGVVTWISSEAEFTPTPIQTREERADLVYAIKVKVANPRGMVKIGMPADVRFVSDAAGP